MMMHKILQNNNVGNENKTHLLLFVLLLMDISIHF